MNEIETTLKEKICICGHNHISYVGEHYNHKDYSHYERIDECENCNCEKFKQKLGEKTE